MKAVEPPQDLASAEDRHAELVDRLLQDSGYLPPQDDQSWRERAALRIAPGFQSDGDEEPDNWDAGEPERIAEPLHESRRRGGFLIALLMIVVIVPIIAILTFPDILTAGFWRAGHSTAHIAAVTPPVAPAPLRAALPQRASVSPAQAALPARPEQALPDHAAKETGKETEVPVIDARKPPTQAPPPVARTASRPASENGQEGGFYAKVVGPDGTLQSQYFPADPSTRPVQQESAGKDHDAGGFYAMVAGPDGTLRYRYFSSKPSQ